MPAAGESAAGPAKQGRAVNTFLYARQQHPCCRRSPFRRTRSRWRRFQAVSVPEPQDRLPQGEGETGNRSRDWPGPEGETGNRSRNRPGPCGSRACSNVFTASLAALARRPALSGVAEFLRQSGCDMSGRMPYECQDIFHILESGCAPGKPMIE